MIMLKKLIWLLACFLLILQAVSCANADGNTLIMATNAAFRPYEYYDKGRITGIDAELAEEIAKRLGKSLQIHDMDFNSVITSVITHKSDMAMAGITKTYERAQAIRFTDPYVVSRQLVLVRKDGPIKHFAQINEPDAEWKIGVQESTTGDIYCTAKYGEGRVLKYKTYNDAVMALEKDKVDCVVIDEAPAHTFAADMENIEILDTEMLEEEYAIAVAMDNPELQKRIDEILNDMRTDGSLQAIIDKYIEE